MKSDDRNQSKHFSHRNKCKWTSAQVLKELRSQIKKTRSSILCHSLETRLKQRDPESLERKVCGIAGRVRMKTKVKHELYLNLRQGTA